MNLELMSVSNKDEGREMIVKREEKRSCQRVGRVLICFKKEVQARDYGIMGIRISGDGGACYVLLVKGPIQHSKEYRHGD
jgi:hypothetical protein